MEYLLHNGTDINTIDSSGRTPLTNILKYHLRKPEVAEQPDDVMTMVDLLTKNGAELNMSQSESCNPLLLSVKSQCHQLVRYFLENGADVDIKC